MTFSIGHVDGGTHAGHRKPMRDKPEAWTCSCPFTNGPLVSAEPKWNPGYLVRCLDCGQRRDRFAEASVAAEQLYA